MGGMAALWIPGMLWGGKVVMRGGMGVLGIPGALRDGTGIPGMLCGKKRVLGVPGVPGDGMGYWRPQGLCQMTWSSHSCWRGPRGAGG